MTEAIMTSRSAHTSLDHKRFRELVDQRDALDEDWPGELDDPAQQEVRAAWDASPEGAELAALMQRFPALRY